MVDNKDNERPAGTGASKDAPVAKQDSSDRTLPPTDVQAYIGRQLRAVYDDVAKQPIPDRFLALMQQLEAKGAS